MVKKEASIAIVNRAKDILSSPDKWIKWVYAADVEGREVGETSDQACKFCVLGALRRAHFELNGPDIDWVDDRYIGARALVTYAIYQMKEDPWFIDQFNDVETTDYEKVVDVLKHAVEPSILLH